MNQPEAKLQIGNRYLIETKVTRYKNKKEVESFEPDEIEVLEFSSSNIYVKIKYPARNKSIDEEFNWTRIDEIKIIEQLENQKGIPF